MLNQVILVGTVKTVKQYGKIELQLDKDTIVPVKMNSKMIKHIKVGTLIGIKAKLVYSEKVLIVEAEKMTFITSKDDNENIN